MNKKTLTALIVAFAMLHGTALRTITRAQEPAATAGGGSVAINNQSGRVQIKLERGSRVAINNRYGRITITGWDRDTVEATATSDKGAEAVQVEMTADPAATESLLTLTVPGRPGQRGPFPFVYTPDINVNVNTNINPRIYTTIPNPKPPSNPTPAPQVQGDAPRAPKANTPPPAKPARPVKTKPSGEDDDNESHIIIMPMPDAAVAPEAVVSGVPPAPATSQSSSGAVGSAIKSAVKSTVKNSARGVGVGIGVGGGVGFGGGESSSISLHVRMPRYAKLEALEVRSGDVNISDIDGPISISSGSSNITVARVGALEVRARSGNINVDGVEGLVYIVATSGTISVRRTKGDVRATSINGDINLHCIKGRVDASNARGGIILGGVEGDVEASTTDADINFIGAIRPQGRYRLKSMEGRVIMAIPETSPGFTAVLASYNKDVVTTFPVANETLSGGSAGVNRRIVVKQGNGDAQITLDSFSQTVHLTKLASGQSTSCQQ
ncbi:MAG TPA: DUF4097 family beta strand repeat-containing protein [Pyrinomonadaceae bacterium]|nr:DUF4097 family beta strand repeat-containing protein [Pyrinomonadaceae bacterium]